MRPGTVTDRAGAIEFLTECARYFENRGTGGEDRAYWANVYNAENCRNTIRLLQETPTDPYQIQSDDDVLTINGVTGTRAQWLSGAMH